MLREEKDDLVDPLEKFEGSDRREVRGTGNELPNDHGVSRSGAIS